VVITDENGVAQFYLVYLKDSAAWIAAEITASTKVLGTETQSVTRFFLGALKSDVTSHLLGDSIYLAP